MAIDPRAAPRRQNPTPRGPLSGGDAVEPVEGATAAQFARNRFGGPTRVNSFPFTFTTTPQIVLGSNPRRVFWLMVNRGIVSVAVDIDPAMTFANGVLLGAAGGFATEDVAEDGETVAWAVFGASESSTAVVRILEVMRV